MIRKIFALLTALLLVLSLTACGHETTAAPTAAPTAEPTAEPTAAPTAEPTAEPTVEPTVEPTEAPAAEAATATDADAATSTDLSGVYQYTGYVYIELNGQFRWYPLAPTEEQSYNVTVRQTSADGSELQNVIHITNEGVYMESSTCENQDCVEEGIVTLENRELRILSNYIVCLPQQVVVELYSPSEFLQWYQNYMSGTAE